MKASLFNLVQEVLIKIVNEGRLDTLLVRNIDDLATSDHFMDALGIYGIT